MYTHPAGFAFLKRRLLALPLANSGYLFDQKTHAPKLIGRHFLTACLEATPYPHPFGRNNAIRAASIARAPPMP